MRSSWVSLQVENRIKSRASIEASAGAQGLFSQDFSPKQFFKFQNTKQADTDGENYR
jgi:hypothetical protein